MREHGSGGPEQEFAQGDQPPADDDHLGIERIRQRGQTHAEPPRDLAHRVARRPIPLQRERPDGLPGQRDRGLQAARAAA